MVTIPRIIPLTATILRINIILITQHTPVDRVPHPPTGDMVTQTTTTGLAHT